MVKGFFNELRATAARLGFADPQWLKDSQEPKFKTDEPAGVGPELLLLHGLLGAVSNWEKVLPGLAKISKPIAFQLPILTAPRPDVKIKALSLYTEAFIRDRNLGPVAVCGNSLGGHVALRLCLAHPELVDCLILTGSSGLYEHTVEALPVRPDREFIHGHMSQVVYNQELVTKEAIDEIYGIISNKLNLVNLVHAAKSAKRDNLFDLLPQIKVPTLLLWGENDTITPMDVAETFNKRIPGSKLVSIKECGHAPMLEHPEWFTAQIEKFLKENSRYYK